MIPRKNKEILEKLKLKIKMVQEKTSLLSGSTSKLLEELQVIKTNMEENNSTTIYSDFGCLPYETANKMNELIEC